MWCRTLIGLLLIAGHPPVAAPEEAPQTDAAQEHADAQETYELFRMLADAVDQIERNYVQPISRRELIEAAMEGIVRKLDPYSSYIAPGDMERFQRSVDSNYTGIGISVDVVDGRLTVRGVIAGSPAYRAGLRSGDRIASINGQPTEGLQLDDTVRRIKGEAGTTVRLTIRHGAAMEPEDIDVAREVIPIETVLPARRHANGTAEYLADPQRRIGYVRITVFGRETPEELERALAELERRKLRGLILDLRFNPGGLLNSAVRVADLFLAEGRIVTVTGRNTQRREIDATPAGTHGGFPMAVLVNRYSASASEILAACLQDHGRAVVVGQRTWGKGSVQNVIELGDGRSALKITTSRYLRPNGQSIHRFAGAPDTDSWGVTPDKGFEVVLSEEEMSQLFQWRQQHDLEAVPGSAAAPGADKTATAPAAGADHPAANAPTGTTDRQLARAMAYLTAELARAD